MEESSLLNCQNYFPGIENELSQLFQPNALPWNALHLLRDFIENSITPNIDLSFMRGAPLTKHLYIMPDGSILDDLEVACNKTTKGRISACGKGGPLPDISVICAGAVLAGENIQLGRGVTIEPGVFIKGPVILGDHTEVRQGAYIRGDVFTGKNCVIGHTTEVKHSIFLDNAKAGHFAYIGDSILGRDVNLGAGTKLANLKFATGNVTLNFEGQKLDTGRRKLGDRKSVV